MTILECQNEWENADIFIKADVLGRLNVDSIDEYVIAFTEEESEWLWNDAIDVLRHVEAEYEAELGG